MSTSSFALACMAFVTSAPCAVAGLEHLEPDIRALAQPMLDDEHAPGMAIGILKAGERITLGVGRVRLDAEGAPTADTLYEIGSISKVFTATLLADAQLRGLLSIDDPLAKFVPEDSDAPEFDGVGITLTQLSTHRSALPRMPPNWFPPDLADPFKGYDRARLFRDLEDIVLTRAPGAQYEYSNLAVGLLGQIVVDVTGAKDYGALLTERITAPLGMSDTTLDLSDQQRARFAPPYNADLRPDRDWTFDALAGAGAIRSTVDDMLTFAEADLAAEKDATNDPARQALAFTHEKRAEFPGDAKGGVALGWHLRGDGARWHNGQTGGYHAFLGIAPQHDLAVVVLANAPTGFVDAFAIGVLKLAAGEAVEPLQIQRPVEVERATLESYVGRYRLNPVNWIAVTLEGHKLFVQLTGQPALRVYPENDAKFRYRVVDAVITFELDDEDRVAALVLHQNGQDMRAPRE
ncbi:MAG: serine hydrolase [Planctomycetes bacterium]|nr:serine hydrolase [Planctomycetota bacterium]